MLGKSKGKRAKRVAEYEMIGWHHLLSEHKFEQTLGGGEGPGRLVCYSPWGQKESEMTE